MASKLGTLLKQARKAAGLTQAKLAQKVGGGLTAADLSKAEQGELTLPIATLRKIAKATGVTQASLVNAAKGSAKPTTTGTTAAGSATVSMRVTPTEKQLLTYYRKADSDTKKAAANVLRGKCSELIPSLLESSGGSASQTQGSVADMLSDALGSLLGNK